jgi:hypothetical protein
MQTPNSFRKIINLLENIEIKPQTVSEDGRGRNIGRSAKGNRTDWVTGQHISNEPLPYSDQASQNSKNPDWMSDTALRGVDTQRIYVDAENSKLPMIGGFSEKENMYVYTADNKANTMGKVNARRIEEILTGNGMKKGEDFTVDPHNAILKISPRWGTKLSLMFKRAPTTYSKKK